MTRRRYVVGADIDLAGWPGAWLRRAVARWLPGSALHEVVDALLADLHAEWADMRRDGRAVRALWLALRIRGYILANVVYIGLPGIAIATLRRTLISGAALCVTAVLMLVMQAMIRGSGQRALERADAPSAVTLTLVPNPRSTIAPQETQASDLLLLEKRETVICGWPPLPATQPPIERIALDPPPIAPPVHNEISGRGGLRPQVAIVPSPDPSCVPLVRIEPQYPRRGRGAEGAVLVELRIDPAGVVEKATILSSEPPGVFDRAVLGAVRKWRYLANLSAPPGAPHPCDGSQVRLMFELADS
jgi:periplasmic protein TonB